MQRHGFAVLRADISRELDNVRRLGAEARDWSDRLVGLPDNIRVRTAGSILHDFYCGAERIFRLVAMGLDGDLPAGSDWYIDLLHRMATEIEPVRPALLDRETARQLEEFLRFRHLFRNLYGFDLDWDRCQVLLQKLPVTLRRLEQQICAFDEFLGSLQDQA